MSNKFFEDFILDDCDLARANFSLTLYLLLYCTRLVLHASMCSVRLAAVAILLLASLGNICTCFCYAMHLALRMTPLVL